MRTLRKSRGMTLVELLIVLFLFSSVMAGLYSAYSVQMRQGIKEFGIAESEMDMVIARNIIERDLSMAGYGLADDYGSLTFKPKPASATDGAPDTLTLRGTAIARKSRSSQAWAYVSNITPPFVSFESWNDAREDLREADAVIIMSPSRSLWMDAGQWLFMLSGDPLDSLFSVESDGDTNPVVNLPPPNHVVYGLHSTGTGTTATQPYYAVKYYLGGTSPSTCAPGTQSLLRGEDARSDDPANGEPILNCVLDLQVAFGFDALSKDGDKSVSVWDNGGAGTSQTLWGGGTITDQSNWKRRLKQIRVYVLVQQGSRDSSYTYANPDPDPAYAGSNKIRVGELSLAGGAVGRDVTLTADQMNYRWRVVSFVVTPRNIRRTM